MKNKNETDYTRNVNKKKLVEKCVFNKKRNKI